MTTLPLFPDLRSTAEKDERSGTFVDNMKLPIHRWFKYSAGFSAQWVESVLADHIAEKGEVTICDPFAGSGTTLLVADGMGIPSWGVEAHPFVARIAASKLLWHTSATQLRDKGNEMMERTRKGKKSSTKYPQLIYKCFDENTLNSLDKLKSSWQTLDDGSSAARLVWLALTAILRPSSSAGTAQWQYILPNKTKKSTTEPFVAFANQIALMSADMEEYQRKADCSQANLLCGDARNFPQVQDRSVDLVVTSPPYANNYDYADATRFEMSFWEEISSWGDLHESVRKYLIRSSSQHASKEKLELSDLLSEEDIAPIATELAKVCNKLSEERLLHGGKKHYHTMIAAYFVDMAKVWHELRRICREGATACFVVGDSAPYGVYVPIDQWLGRLAVAAGFKCFHFEKLRDRNVKWKNRKHRVPLHEGRLWVSG